MMSMWKIKEIDLGYYDVLVATDEVVIPDWADLAVTMALSIVLAPKYGKSISAELAAVAQSSIEAISTKILSEKALPVDLSYLPAGAGKTGLGSNILSDG